MTDRERQLLDKLKQKEAEERREEAKRQRQFMSMCKRHFGLTPSEIADALQAKADDVKPTETREATQGHSSWRAVARGGAVGGGR